MFIICISSTSTAFSPPKPDDFFHKSESKTQFPLVGKSHSSGRSLKAYLKKKVNRPLRFFLCSMHFFSFLAALRISRQKRRAAAVARRRCLRRHSQLHFRARLLKPVRPFLLRRARLKTLPLFFKHHLSAVPKIFAQTIQVFGDLGFVLCSKLNI